MILSPLSLPPHLCFLFFPFLSFSLIVSPLMMEALCHKFIKAVLSGVASDPLHSSHKLSLTPKE